MDIYEIIFRLIIQVPIWFTYILYKISMWMIESEDSWFHRWFPSNGMVILVFLLFVTFISGVKDVYLISSYFGDD